MLVPVDPHRIQVLALREPGDLGQYRTSRIPADVFAQAVEVVEVELVHHLDQAFAADIVAGRQRIHVALRLHRLARVGTNHRQKGLVHYPPVGKLQHRDVDALHVHIRRIGPETDPADVGEVGGAGEQADQPAAVEAGRGQHEVVEVSGAHPRIVGDVDVALAHGLGRKVAQEMPHRFGHRIDVARRPGHGLGKHPSVAIEYARGQVTGLADDRRERRAQKRLGLLLDDGNQTVPHHLHADGTDGIAVHACSPFRRRMTRWPFAATRTP